MESPPAVVQRFSRIARFLVILTAGGFALIPFLFLSRTVEYHGYYIGGMNWRGFLYCLAFLPGAVAVVYHLISTPARRQRGRRLIARYAEIRDAALNLTGSSDAVEFDDESSSVIAACCASLFLTGVFLLVAVIADHFLGAQKGQDPTLLKSMEGIVFCGVGAYVAVLYYMAGRLYANALSSRFVTTSALRSASAVAVGWVAGMVGIDAVLPNNTTSGVFFLIGLFYNWAISAMRTKALNWLGAPKSDNDELPITIVEGIDDTAADLLNEYGITTLQHLVEAEPAELSERTLIPINRILEWMDQAMLIQRVKRNIVAMRSSGVRTATDLARIYALAKTDDPTAVDLLKSLAERTALGAPALHVISREFQFNMMLNIIYDALEGKPLTLPSNHSGGSFADRSGGGNMALRATARLPTAL
ncbi:MAG TPA: hypothetical protein VGK04_11730 [Thermoanaerobaculia bacterium]